MACVPGFHDWEEISRSTSYVEDRNGNTKKLTTIIYVCKKCGARRASTS